MDKPVIYTIGHSTHAFVYFLELLTAHNITCVVDVRSRPASRFNPQYNKKSLTTSLNAHNIAYLHFGDAFGARQTDPDLLHAEGWVDFEKMRASEKFKTGIERLRKGSRDGHTIALMCSEAEPLHCHRFSMISPALKGFGISHILKDKSLLSQGELEDQLLKMFSKKIAQPTIFQPETDRSESLNTAYRLINREVAYSPGSFPKKGKK